MSPRDAAPVAAPACRTEFKVPSEAGRDERFIHRGADAAEMPPRGDSEPHTREEFERYSTEMLAAETVAVVMHSIAGMPSNT